MGKVDAVGGPYQRHATAQNVTSNQVIKRNLETKNISKLEDQAGYTSVKMAELGHLTWLSAKMATKSSHPSQNGSGHMLYEKTTQLRWR